MMKKYTSVIEKGYNLILNPGQPTYCVLPERKTPKWMNMDWIDVALVPDIYSRHSTNTGEARTLTMVVVDTDIPPWATEEFLLKELAGALAMQAERCSRPPYTELNFAPAFTVTYKDLKQVEPSFQWQEVPCLNSGTTSCRINGDAAGDRSIKWSASIEKDSDDNVICSYVTTGTRNTEFNPNSVKLFNNGDSSVETTRKYLEEIVIDRGMFTTY